ncbi:hypothetical protein AVEN_19223-1 [Araneus ventricosus]|uniref:Uncharacterized protein n=1 Tax=Araneus ventricosus TaxID=182803 RepID=A0A4Y2GS48_ARAVE|nr:hypothetical protein AVEN_19223-1 [Araneus ventricosus]
MQMLIGKLEQDAAMPDPILSSRYPIVKKSDFPIPGNNEQLGYTYKKHSGKSTTIHHILSRFAWSTRASNRSLEELFTVWWLSGCFSIVRLSGQQQLQKYKQDYSWQFRENSYYSSQLLTVLPANNFKNNTSTYRD